MTKLIAITLAAFALTACSSMSDSRMMGNTAETKNSTDANKSSNPAAVSPGGGAAGSSGSAPR
jgi:uncharacterized protein YcfL